MKTYPLIFLVCVALTGAASAQDSSDHVTHYTAADGTQVTLYSGQPRVQSYGPKPAFEQLDSNHDGIISRAEAEAYVPLLNDFDNVTHNGQSISKAQYARWDQR